jgi:hypothetical protein
MERITFDYQTGGLPFCNEGTREARLLGEAGYLPKSRAKLQDNYKLLNECLRENGNRRRYLTG